MSLLDNSLFQWFLDRFGYPLYSGVIRTGRVILYGALVYGVTWGLDNYADLNIDAGYKYLIASLLIGADKYLREHRAELRDGELDKG